MNDQKSPHILNASSNLIGFSFLFLTSIRVLGLHTTTLIDEMAALEVCIFSLSCFFSFLSLRIQQNETSNSYEKFAGIIFFIGLTILVATSVVVTFDIFV